MQPSDATATTLPRAVFLLTVDLELAWGLAHSSRPAPLAELRRDPSHGRRAVDTLLRVMEKHQVPATWAVVGHLFLQNCDKNGGVPHPDIPRPTPEWFDVDPGTDAGSDPLFYAPDIIEKVMSNSIKHEIGHHSFSHVTFNSCSAEVARAEVAEGLRLGRAWGITPRSFVFPRNQVGHVGVLKTQGIRIYRSPTLFYRPKYVAPGRLGTGIWDLLVALPIQPKLSEGVWQVPGSLYFNEPRVPFTLVPRARAGIRRAIQQRAVFQVFLHEWNLVVDPSLGEKLDRLLGFVARCRELGELETTTMAGLADRLEDPA